MAPCQAQAPKAPWAGLSLGRGPHSSTDWARAVQVCQIPRLTVAPLVIFVANLPLVDQDLLDPLSRSEAQMAPAALGPTGLHLNAVPRDPTPNFWALDLRDLRILDLHTDLGSGLRMVPWDPTVQCTVPRRISWKGDLCQCSNQTIKSSR